jgi:hypothetical protein
LHFVWAGIFVGIGYGAQQLERSMLKDLEKERDRLVKRRMLRTASE